MSGFIQGLSTQAFFILLGLCAAFSAILIFGGMRGRRLWRLVQRTPLVKIGAGGSGLVAVKGRAEPIIREPLEAPLTGAQCVWFRSSIEQYTYNDDHSKDKSPQWITVQSLQSQAPFLLSDGSAACVVFPGGEITPADRSEWRGATETPTDRQPPRFSPLDPPLGIESANLTSASYRYREERIYAGSELFVIGTLGSFPTAAEEDLEDSTDEESLDDADAARSGDDAAAPDDDLEPGEGQLVEFEARAHEAGARLGKKQLSGCRIVAAAPREKIIELYRRGSVLALRAAALPIVGAAWLIWVRFLAER